MTTAWDQSPAGGPGLYQRPLLPPCSMTQPDRPGHDTETAPSSFPAVPAFLPRAQSRPGWRWSASVWLARGWFLQAPAGGFSRSQLSSPASCVHHPVHHRDARVTAWPRPVNLADLSDFGAADLRHRLLRGGLPPFFLAEPLPERDFQEWLDAYLAKDILQLFRLERRHSLPRPAG